MQRLRIKKCSPFSVQTRIAELSVNPSLLPWGRPTCGRCPVAEGRMRGTSQSGRPIKPFVPLTLALSPQGRGDKNLCPPKNQTSRRGFTILEMIVAMLLLGTAMAIVVPTLAWMGVQNRLSLQRQEAVQGLNNLMDELTSRPYAELTPEAAGKIELSDALKRQLPGAKLHVEITEAEPSAKRIQAQLAWNQQNGGTLAPVRLTAWVHPREDQR